MDGRNSSRRRGTRFERVRDEFEDGRGAAKKAAQRESNGTLGWLWCCAALAGGF